MIVTIRPLQEPDLAEADRIFRLAFGTFLGMADPLTFGGDTDPVRTRWRADPARAFAAEVDGRLVGSNVLTHMGSVGLFGPLTVHPDFWDQGVASQLLEPTMALFDEWGVEHMGLYTFSSSAKHIHLYQKFGFWPRFLTAIMARSVDRSGPAGDLSTFASLSPTEQDGCLRDCRDLTDAIYPGLDVVGEIRAVQDQGLGDTVLLWSGSTLAGLAVCHCGAGTEAGSGLCYIKFAAVRPGRQAGKRFDQLVADCEALAATRGLSQVSGGVNVARHEAYRSLLARGYRTAQFGVAMQRPNEPGFNRAGVYVIDDWR